VSVLVCGGTPSESDRAAVEAFAAALRLPTREATARALLEMSADAEDLR
jgi:hypothetical protein